MDRITEIKLLASKKVPRAANGEKTTLISAMMSCLTADEISNLLSDLINLPAQMHGVLSRVLRTQIDTGKIADPEPVVQALMGQIANSELPAYRRTVGCCLAEVALSCNQKQQWQIQQFFSLSCSIELRSYGYQLYSAESAQSRATLEAAWHQYRDYKAACIIIGSFPPSFLMQERASLSKKASRKQLGLLYLRISEHTPAAFNELLKLDAIFYVYVAAKRNIALPDNVIEQIFQQHKTDEHFGLLLWSLGQMKRWDILSEHSNLLV